MVTLNEVIFDMKELLVLFLTFAKVGVMTFGGGYAMLPILQREVVENKGWATDEELTDYFAIGQCTPGVIAVNTATFIGQKKGGVAGGVVLGMGGAGGEGRTGSSGAPGSPGDPGLPGMPGPDAAPAPPVSPQSPSGPVLA